MAPPPITSGINNEQVFIWLVVQRHSKGTVFWPNDSRSSSTLSTSMFFLQALLPLRVLCVTRDGAPTALSVFLVWLLGLAFVVALHIVRGVDESDRGLGKLSRELDPDATCQSEPQHFKPDINQLEFARVAFDVLQVENELSISRSVGSRGMK